MVSIAVNAPLNALLPIAIFESDIVDVFKVSTPIAILFTPVRSPDNALLPSETFPFPVVIEVIDPLPMAVFSVPVKKKSARVFSPIAILSDPGANEFAIALRPMAIFLSETTADNKAFDPTTVLLAPVVLLCPADAPIHVLSDASDN